MVTAVVPMTLGASRRGRGVLLAAIVLVQCYATRTQDGCAALSYHGGVPGAGRGLPQVRQQGVGLRRDLAGSASAMIGLRRSHRLAPDLERQGRRYPYPATAAVALSLVGARRGAP